MKPAGACLEENQFPQGEVVVFRMYANDDTTGGTSLTDANVKTVFVTVPRRDGPDSDDLQGRGTPRVAYWEGTWNTTGYTLGTVKVTVVTVVAKPPRQWGVASLKDSKIPAQSGIFSQSGFATVSDLTVIAA